jgi:DNA-binding NarL/FixJ family response regulator
MQTRLGAETYEALLHQGEAMRLEDALDVAAPLLQQIRNAPTAVQAPGSAPFGLTPREREVLQFLVEGRSDRQIGEVLSISHRTVMRHVEHILTKLEVESRTAAATKAVRLEIL